MASITLQFHCGDDSHAKDLVRYMESFFNRIGSIQYDGVAVTFTGYGTQRQIDEAVAHITRIQKS